MTESPPRKTLVQLAGESKVRDAAAFARHKLLELDKTAHDSIMKKKDVRIN